MLRKVPAMLLTAALLTGSVAATAALAQETAVQQKITVKLNGNELPFPQDVVTENGVAYVNASTLAHALDASAAWDTMIESLLISKNNQYALRMYKNSHFAYKNGKEIHVAHPPRVTTGAVLVPLVYIAQELGATVSYDANTLTYNLSVPVEK